MDRTGLEAAVFNTDAELVAEVARVAAAEAEAAQAEAEAVAAEQAAAARREADLADQEALRLRAKDCHADMGTVMLGCGDLVARLAPGALYDRPETVFDSGVQLARETALGRPVQREVCLGPQTLAEFGRHGRGYAVLEAWNDQYQPFTYGEYATGDPYIYTVRFIFREGALYGGMFRRTEGGLEVTVGVEEFSLEVLEGLPNDDGFVASATLDAAEAAVSTAGSDFAGTRTLILDSLSGDVGREYNPELQALLARHGSAAGSALVRLRQVPADVMPASEIAINYAAALRNSGQSGKIGQY